jgi:2,3,4,5-tetrahydropyridine-2-carboxylate N-succinyltransferase
MHTYAIGIASKNKNKELLDVCFFAIGSSPVDFEAIAKSFQKTSNSEIEITEKELPILQKILPHLKLTGESSEGRQLLLSLLFQDKEIATVAEAYLKLHLLSKRIYKPRELNLTNLFSVMPNVAWTNQGAVDIKEVEERQFYSRKTKNPLLIKNVDKIPAMCDYVIPSKVRIGDAARVRLGAYLGAGTTIMHEGFVNFNAGTEGPNMIEGRISAGVFVGKGTDLGGGCSIMGTLSGGGKTVISVGEDCLIGANAGLGISLGARCVVEAGLYLTSGTKLKVLDKDQQEITQTKAITLSEKSDLLFRRNSLSGNVECLANKNRVELNEILHHN